MEKKQKKTNEVVSLVKQNIVTILGIIFAVVNLWIAAKLSPLSESITKIANRAEANETKISDVEKSCSKSDANIKIELQYVRERVDDIYNILLDI